LFKGYFMAHTLTTCTFCGVGCGIYLETSGNEIIGTYPSMSHPANCGRICLRGWHVHEVASATDRLKQPLIKKDNTFQPVSWSEAYDFIAKRLTDIKAKYGPDAIGFLNSSHCGNEDGYILQKLARAVIGTNNVDQGTALYHSNSIRALSATLGVAAATNSIAELMKSDVIIVSQIDLGRQLPTIGGWVIRAKLGGAKLIVIGSRRNRVAEHADYFLQTTPWTEAFLYGALAKVIVDRGLMDLDFVRQRCNAYELFLKNTESFDVLQAASLCGLSPDLIEQAAITYAKASNAMILYSTGAEASGRDLLHSMANLALLTGNIGKPGAGIMPLTEHNNLQGACDLGMVPSYLPGYVPVRNLEGRKRFEKVWGRPLPDRRGMDSSTMLGTRGNLKAIWLDRHNPVVSTAQCDASVALQKMEFVVLQNLFMTPTAQYAHVILPTAAYGEETVTFTSLERRIQLAQKAVEPPSGLTSAWCQVVEIAGRLGVEWHYDTSSDVMNEIGRIVPFYEGASYENLAQHYGRQWPCTHERPLGTPYLFADQGGGRQFSFVPINQLPPATRTTAEFPFVLMFGRSLYYWHQNTMVQHSETLKREYGILLLDYPEGFVDINPEDAEALKIRDGMKIRLISGVGSATTYGRVTNEIRQGTIYVPFFLQDIAKQILGPAGTEYRAGSRTIYVKVEKA
jgi:predicted molibdopterin-dependent oxidoreductase YjgC